jgi:hypothetical protein
MRRSLIVLVIEVLGCVLADSIHKPPITIEKSIKIGDSKNHVDRFLRTNNIEHSWDSDDRSFTAIERELNSGALVTSSRLVIVAIDKDGNVSNITGRDVFTGP